MAAFQTENKRSDIKWLEVQFLFFKKKNINLIFFVLFIVYAQHQLLVAHLILSHLIPGITFICVPGMFLSSNSLFSHFVEFYITEEMPI